MASTECMKLLLWTSMVLIFQSLVNDSTSDWLKASEENWLLIVKTDHVSCIQASDWSLSLGHM